MTFEMPWQQSAPFNGGRPAQQHVEYLTAHPKPTDDRLKVVHLLIDNRDRMTGFDAQRGALAPFNFVVRFEPISEIVSAEIKMLACPKPAQESYVIVDIPEFGDSLVSSNQDSHQKFAVAYFDQPPSVAESKPMKADLISSRHITFDNPKTLDRLDICLRQYGGSVITAPPDTSTNVSLWIDFTCRQISPFYGM